MIIDVVLSGDHAFIFTVGLDEFVLLDVLVYLLNLAFIILLALSHPLYAVEVLAEFVHFRNKVLGRKVQHELYWQILEHIYFVLFTEFVHI